MPVTHHRNHLSPVALFAAFNQGIHQRAAKTASSGAGIDIDRLFKRIAIGRASAIQRGIAVTHHHTTIKRHQPGQPLGGDIAHALAHFINSGRDFFKRGATVQHMPGIDGGNRVDIVRLGVAHLNFIRR
ncbi:hypothetical protein D3C72_1652130 [compost metagenome]